ncbi:MAG: hypothetical protein K6U00_11190, partial [Armatimonadetes bacterium]|nr:hypothetical protein [Armatimonadota bacterium]
MAVRVGINGFGRIGRLTLRAILEKYPNDIEVVALNDLVDAQTNAHLFKWDSNYGPFNGEVGFEEKDIVVVRSTGKPTYLASDIAYHYDKFVRRGFDWVINIWGADHQGHVSRLKAAVEALGIDREKLDILIYQLVHFRRGAETLRLSKRRGQIITVRDVVDEVGADAAKFFFLSRSADSQLEFDLELAKRQSAENPVYYVQYA